MPSFAGVLRSRAAIALACCATVASAAGASASPAAAQQPTYRAASGSLSVALPVLGRPLPFASRTSLALGDTSGREGFVALVEEDPHPYDGVWSVVAEQVAVPAGGVVAVPVRPRRDTLYRVRDSRGREALLLQDVDLAKRLTVRRRALDGTRGFRTPRRARFTVTLDVRGPDADLTGRRARIGVQSASGRLLRVLRPPLRRISRNRWRARRAFRNSGFGDFTVCLPEPPGDAFAGESPRRLDCRADVG